MFAALDFANLISILLVAVVSFLVDALHSYTPYITELYLIENSLPVTKRKC